MRKNILIFGHDYITQFVDIYNQYTRLFNKNEYEVTLVYLTGEPNEDIKKRTLAENCIFLNLPKKNIRSLKIRAILELYALTRKKRFQLVICHRYKPTYIMMWVSRFCRVPVLISVMHELGTMSPVHRQLLVACLAGKNILFAGVSNAVRDDIRKCLRHLPKERIITLYNMIDVELTEPQLHDKYKARTELKLPQDAMIFGNLGRLVKNKDQKSLIQAFALIKPYCPNAKLLIMGTGECGPYLKHQVAAFSLENEVIFTGFVARGFRYMKAFDCFVLSSTQEAFGRVLLEAMIAKLPIIATRVNGVPEVLENTGLLVEPKDTLELARAMQKIYELSESDRVGCGDSAYHYVIKYFSIPKFHEQFWQLPQIQGIKAETTS